MKQRLQGHGAVAGLYLLLTLLLWWPLPARFLTHVPGSETWAFDEYTFVWNLWWFRHSLLDLGTSALHSDFLFYPLGIDLVLYTYNIINAAIALPLLDWIGPVAASNLILVGMTVLSGWGTWLLVRWLLARTLAASGPAAWGAAFGAGALYAFGANRAVYAALGHYDLVSTGFIPLFTLFFLRVFWGSAPGRDHPSRWRAALLTGLFMAGALGNEMIFGTFLATLALLLMALTFRRAAPGWLQRGIVAAAVAALLWAPVGVPVIRTLFSTDFVLTGWGDALKLSADLLSFTSPTALHPLWGPDWVAELRAVQVNVVSPGSSRFGDVNTVFVGIGVLLAAALALVVYGRRVGVWAVGLAGFMVLSLGPVLQVGGRYLWSFDNLLPGGQPTAVPLPFLLLHYLPVVNGNRAANRYSVVLMLCAAVLVGYALFWLARRVGGGRRGGAVALALGALLLVEHLSFPLPLTDARIPAIYEQVAADPDDVAILTLPLGWRNSFGVTGAENTRNQWYMVGHGKRLVQGNISRAPAEKLAYWRTLPVLRSLIEIQNDREVPAEQQADDAARALETMRLLGVRYVVVHPGIPGRPPYVDNRERALAYLREVLPMEPLAEAEGALLFRVPDGPARQEIDLGTAESAIYRVAGWYPDEQDGGTTFNWAGPRATVLLPLPSGEAQRLTLRLRPFQPGQSLRATVNGQPVGGERLLGSEWNEITLSLPAAALRGPTADLVLEFERADRPVDVIPALAAIGTTGTSSRARITVKSAAEGLGPFGALAWITVNDEDASDHRAGTNVTVVDPATGAVEAVRGFDTTANEFERDALHAFLAQIAPGRVVVVALKGGATAFLNEQSVAAFRDLGAATGPTEHGVSYALIGVKGAAPGSALEAESATDAVDLLHLPDQRPLSAAVERIWWGPAPPGGP